MTKKTVLYFHFRCAFNLIIFIYDFGICTAFIILYSRLYLAIIGANLAINTVSRYSSLVYLFQIIIRSRVNTITHFQSRHFKWGTYEWKKETERKKRRPYRHWYCYLVLICVKLYRTMDTHKPIKFICLFHAYVCKKNGETLFSCYFNWIFIVDGC